MSDPWDQFPDAPATKQSATGGNDPWAQFPDAQKAESSAIHEAVTQPVYGFNEGLDTLYNLPNTAMNVGAHAANLAANAWRRNKGYPEQEYTAPLGYARIASRFNEPDPWSNIANNVAQGVGVDKPFPNAAPETGGDQPETTIGRYGRSIGQQAGASVVPMAGMLRAGLMPATNAVLAQNAASAAGAGVTTQAARDAGYGPIGQTIAGVAGGFAAPTFYNVGARATGIGKNAVNYGRMAAEEGRNPQLSSDRTLNEALGQAGTSAEELRDLAIPKFPPQSSLPSVGFKESHLAEMIGRRLDGEDSKSIAQDFTNRRLPISADTVDNYVDRYRAQNPTPKTMMEYVEQAAGPGAAMPLTRLVRREQIISKDVQPFLRLNQRQIDQPARLTGMVDRVLPEAATAEEMNAAERMAQQRAVDLIDRDYPAQNYEQGRKRLTDIAKAQNQSAYDELHARPDVIVDKNLAQLMALPEGKLAYDLAAREAAAEGKPIPSRTELAKIFGVNPNPGFGLNKQGVPVPPQQYPIGVQPALSSRAGAPQPSTYWTANAPDQAQSLIAFLKSRGGIRPSGETAAFNAERVPGLINKRGMTADRAREALIESGFIREDPSAPAATSVADFYDLLGRAVSGKTVTRIGEEGLPFQGAEFAQNRAEAARAEAMVRDHLREIGIDPKVYDTLPAVRRQEIAQRIAVGAENGQLEQQARAYFPEGVFNRLTPVERTTLARRINAGEDPDTVFEELAIRAEGNSSLDRTGAGRDRSEIQPTAIVPVRALDYFQRALRRAGRDPSNPASSGFNALRGRFIEQLDPYNPSPENPTHIPGFRQTMRDYRESMGHREALDLAATLEPKLNEKTYQTLADFEHNMTPVEQELFRLRFARKIQDTIQNQSFGSDVLADFDSPAAQHIIQRVFPPEEAERFINGIANERLTAQAAKLGERLAGKIGSDPDPQELRIFGTMDAQQKDIFKGGFSRGLRAQIGRKSEGQDVASQFNKENAQNIIDKVLPPKTKSDIKKGVSSKEADYLKKGIKEEATSTKIKNAIYGNSNTAQTAYDINTSENAANAIAAMGTLNPRRWFDSWFTALARKVGEERATMIVRDATEMDPAEQLRLFERLMGTSPSPVDRSMLSILRGPERPYGPGRAWMAGEAAQTASRAGEPTKPLPPGYTPRAALNEARAKLARNPNSPKVRDAVAQRLKEHGLTLEHDPSNLLASPDNSVVAH
jgi:hypothetical protein